VNRLGHEGRRMAGDGWTRYRGHFKRKTLENNGDEVRCGMEHEMGMGENTVAFAGCRGQFSDEEKV
jgi:hypothetical protein